MSKIFNLLIYAVCSVRILDDKGNSQEIKNPSNQKTKTISDSPNIKQQAGKSVKEECNQ